MSKLEMLNSYLMERLAVAVREILEAVEATVTEYRTETAQTRIENQTLKQQLRELLTTVRGKCSVNNKRRSCVPYRKSGIITLGSAASSEKTVSSG